jgi:hypothetical protein
MLLCLVDKSDRHLVAVARVVREGEQAVVRRHHSVDVSELTDDTGELLRQHEPGHHIGQHEHPLAKNICEPLLPVGQVRHGHDRIGVGVIDERVRNEPMNNGLDRGIVGRWVEARPQQLGHHVSVTEHFELGETSDRLALHSGEPLDAHRCQVEAAGFDEDATMVFAESIGRGGLDRRIAASVQDEGAVPSNEARAVCTDVKGVPGGGVGVIPLALHLAEAPIKEMS